MSVIFVVAPAVAAGWPVLAAAAAGLAGRVGLRLMEEGRIDQQQQQRARETVAEEVGARTLATVTIPMEGSQIVSEKLGTGTALCFDREDGVQITLSVDEQSRAILHVGGGEKTEEELQEIGQEFLGQLLQQYAYETIVNELEGSGYKLVQEEVDGDGRIQLRVRRWD